MLWGQHNALHWHIANPQAVLLSLVTKLKHLKEIQLQSQEKCCFLQHLQWLSKANTHIKKTWLCDLDIKNSFETWLKHCDILNNSTEKQIYSGKNKRNKKPNWPGCIMYTALSPSSISEGYRHNDGYRRWMEEL